MYTHSALVVLCAPAVRFSALSRDTESPCHGYRGGQFHMGGWGRAETIVFSRKIFVFRFRIQDENKLSQIMLEKTFCRLQEQKIVCPSVSRYMFINPLMRKILHFRRPKIKKLSLNYVRKKICRVIPKKKKFVAWKKLYI